MWPKMLIEILPHLARLLPMWDKFLISKAANDKAAESALNAMAEGVRGDLGQVTAAHAGLYRQLQDQSARIDTLAASLADDLRMTRESAARAEAAAHTIGTETVALTSAVRRIGIGLVVVVLLLVVVITLQILHHGG